MAKWLDCWPDSPDGRTTLQNVARRLPHDRPVDRTLGHTVDRPVDGTRSYTPSAVQPGGQANCRPGCRSVPNPRERTLTRFQSAEWTIGRPLRGATHSRSQCLGLSFAPPAGI